MKQIKLEIYVKNGKNYELSRYTLDIEGIYRALADDMINKKLLDCTYIKRIVRNPNYDGTQEISVYYDNGVKAVYTVYDSI